MIGSFRSKALLRYWVKGDERGLRPDWRKVRIILSRLDAARTPTELNLPGLRFHALTGNLKGGRFAVSVLPNWRITFAWDGPDAWQIGR